MSGYDDTADVDHDGQAFWRDWSAQVDRELELADDTAWVEVPA